ncbi:DUF4376 domain-containing protein [Citrobacter sp. Cpo113]|uniref:DUF4376 domain-containing protein n=1 Tax=Citrobacter sp. Cpo113 TaxID=2985146 RepID=UPI002574E8CB|nr:DUF4376 domain-containing protein [Citrobacter sp. Cpo113]MDM2789422.1 DUF4376 domain-containing protein [Citrobacter sp. Cpo113]
MEIKEIRSPRYLENGYIDCEILFTGFDDFIPYTASPDDNEPLGQSVMTSLLSGEWGEIAPYIMPENALKLARETKCAEISRWRDRQESGNIIFELDGHRWDGGKASQERLAPVVAAANAGMLPEGFFWTDADNHDIPVNVGFLQQLETAMVQAMVILGFKIHERQRQMKEEVALMTEMNAIIAYQPGWPEEGE